MKTSPCRHKLQQSFWYRYILFLIPFSLSVEAGYTFIVPEKSNSYLQAVNDIQDNINVASVTKTIKEIEINLKNNKKRNSGLYVTLGDEAYKFAIDALSFDNPIISAYAPSARRETLHASLNHLVIFNDADAGLLIDLAVKIYGNDVGIGIFFSEQTKHYVADIEEKQQKGVRVASQYIHPFANPNRQLKRFIKKNDIDVFIILPSFDIYTPARISSLLFILSQEGKGAIGYSKSMLNGVHGALAVIDYGVEHINKEISKQIKYFLTNKKLSSTYSLPELSTIETNNSLKKRYGLK